MVKLPRWLNYGNNQINQKRSSKEDTIIPFSGVSLSTVSLPVVNHRLRINFPNYQQCLLLTGVQPLTSSWLCDPGYLKHRILLPTYRQKDNNSLSLSHHAYVIPLTSFHHVGIVLSHINTRRGMNTVQWDILREATFLYFIIFIIVY